MTTLSQAVHNRPSSGKHGTLAPYRNPKGGGNGGKEVCEGADFVLEAIALGLLDRNSSVSFQWINPQGAIHFGSCPLAQFPSFPGNALLGATFAQIFKHRGAEASRELADRVIALNDLHSDFLGARRLLAQAALEEKEAQDRRQRGKSVEHRHRHLVAAAS